MSHPFIPRQYQKRPTEFLGATRRAALWSPVGTGKTGIATKIVHDSVMGFDTVNWLFVCPKRVAQTTLPSELTKWDHTQKLKTQNLVGLDRREREKRARQSKAFDLTIINIDNLIWLIDLFRASWPYDGLIIDESSLLKDPSTKRFKRLRRVAAKCERVILMTGSPCAQSLMGLWSQMYLIDQGEALGRSLTQFRNTYFDTDYNGFSYTLKPGAEQAILARIKHLVCTVDESELGTPNHPLRLTIPVRLDPDTQSKYDELQQDAITEVGQDALVTAANAAVLVGKLQQVANGAVYHENDHAERETVELHDCKLEALKDFTSEQQGNPYLLAYHYQSDRSRIQRVLGNAVQFFNGSPAQMAQWQAGKIPVLALHPQSGGHGTDGLQHASCTVLWFSPPWSREMYDQVNGRVTGERQKGTKFGGQPGRIYHLICENTVDEVVMSTLQERGATQERALKTLHDYIKRMKT